MESKPKLQPFYFKVWNGTQVTTTGKRLIKPLTVKSQWLLKKQQNLYRQGITIGLYKEMQAERKELANRIERLKLENQTHKSWCVCFMATCKTGAEARLIRCVFGGVLNIETQGYSLVNKQVYEFNLNPERFSYEVDKLLN